MAGATPWTPGRPADGLTAAAAVVLMLAAAAAYTGWWLASPGDCTALPPAAGGWRAEGVRPELRGLCAALRDGDVIVAVASDPGGVAYTVLRDGATAVAVEPQGTPRLAAALAASWSFVVFTGALAAVAGYAFRRRRRDPAVSPLLVFAGALLGSSTVTLLGLPASALGSGWLWLYLANVQVVYTIAWSAMLSFALQFRGTAGPARRAGCYAVPLAALAAGALLVPGDVGSTGWVGGLIVVQSAISVALIVAAVAVSVRRFRGGGEDPVARQQLRVLAAGT